jgi:hypothetical protein
MVLTPLRFRRSARDQLLSKRYYNSVTRATLMEFARSHPGARGVLAAEREANPPFGVRVGRMGIGIDDSAEVEVGPWGRWVPFRAQCGTISIAHGRYRYELECPPHGGLIVIAHNSSLLRYNHWVGWIGTHEFLERALGRQDWRELFTRLQPVESDARRFAPVERWWSSPPAADD